MITTITGKNQITIPAALVRRLNLQPGHRLDWSVGEDGELIGRVLPNKADLAKMAAGMGSEWLENGADPVADLIEERVRDDEDKGLA